MMRTGAIAFSLEGIDLLLETSSKREWRVTPLSEKELSSGFYLQPARAAIQALLERVSTSGSLELSFESDLKSHTFDVKSVSEWKKSFSLYTEKFREGVKKLSEILSRTETFVSLQGRSQDGAEEYFFGTVRETESGLEVFPSTIEWLTFFLFGEGLYARLLVRPESSDRSHWRIFLSTPKRVERILTGKEPEEVKRARFLPTCQSSGQTAKRRKGVSVQLKVSSTCNFGCDFCYYRERLRKPQFIDLERTLPVLKEFFRRFAEVRDARGTVLLHGGEPLMHPEIETLCQRLERELEGLLSEERPFLITTNGLLLSEKKGIFSCLNHIAVSFNTNRFEGKPKLYEKFVSALREVYPHYRQKISFLSLIGLESPESLISAYEKLLKDMGARAVRFSAERLVSEDPDENFKLTHRKFLEENLELLDRVRERRDLFFWPKLYLSGKVSFSVHGCGRCSLPNIFDIDGSIRVCAKNYEIPPIFELESLLELITSTEDDEEFLSLMSFLHLGEERTLRQIVCSLLGCDLSEYCSTGCINFPIVDSSEMCAMLVREAMKS